MATHRDYYEVLGLAREASGSEVKSAYRKLAVQFHPDKNPGDTEAEERFKEAAEAYAVLSDPEKRAAYDRFGHRGVGGGGFGGFDPTTFGDFADILGDFFGFGFGDLFGGSRRGSRRRPGADLRYELELTLEEAAFGVAKTLKIPRLETCASCQGSGAKAGTAAAACGACGGRGQVRFTQGFLTVARTCPQCMGQGTVVSDPCVDCSGEGRVPRERSIELKIPAGVDAGSRLRLSAEGEHGRYGGPTGDLYVDIEITPHLTFQRHGHDVTSQVPLTYSQAVLGATVMLDTLDGEASLEIPREPPTEASSGYGQKE